MHTSLGARGCCGEMLACDSREGRGKGEGMGAIQGVDAPTVDEMLIYGGNEQLRPQLQYGFLPLLQKLQFPVNIYSGTPKCGHQDTSCNQDTSFCPNAMQTCIVFPLKSGHLSNQDTCYRF